MQFVVEKRKEIAQRLAVVRAEVTQLEITDAALAGVPLDAITRARAELGLDRARPAVAGRGQRSAQVLAVVQAHPAGVLASTIAEEIGISSTHVYHPLARLAVTGSVIKDGRLWLPATADAGRP
jgi:hypothetical protein